MLDTILNVPYSSQYLSIKEKMLALTACGMTSVYMVLKYYKVKCSSLEGLVRKGVKNGGYSKSGWLHGYLIQTFTENGISSQRKEHMKDSAIKEIGDSLKTGNPVIISMQRFSFDRRIFHMVVLVGVREKKLENEKGETKIEGFFYHDPAGLNPEEVTNLFVPVGVFLQYWRRMAIFPKNTLPSSM